MTSRIVAFIDHEIGWQLLQRIISAQDEYGFELVAAVTTRENGIMWWPSVSKLCKKAKIPLFEYTESFTKTLNLKNIDWYFLLSWKYIIPPLLLKHPIKGAINLHYSLLPDYRGVYPVNWAIIDGRKKTGVTYHLVGKKIDDGIVIFQKETSIYLSDTARSLQLRLDKLAYGLFDFVLAWAILGRNSENIFPLGSGCKGSYKSYSDFTKTNEINLNQKYYALDFFNLLRGKTFRSDSGILYVTDPDTGKRIYVSIKLDKED